MDLDESQSSDTIQRSMGVGAAPQGPHNKKKEMILDGVISKGDKKMEDLLRAHGGKTGEELKAGKNNK